MIDAFVAPEVVRERMTRLTEVVERNALLRHEARIGRVEEVLVEGPSKKDPERLSGRTRQAKLVHFVADATEVPAGSYATVRIRSAMPHWLGGDLVDVISTPEPTATRSSIRPPIRGPVRTPVLIPVRAG
jgi:tRNA-2-methylthio-N6-dimethylallyladenosine synthase